MYGLPILSDGGTKMSFWTQLIILLLVLIAIYIIFNIVIFKDKDINLNKKRQRLINIELIVAAVLLYGLFLINMPTQSFFQGLIDSINNICVLALATTGIVLIYKTSTTTNFAQGMMASTGAFVAAVVIGSLASKANLSKLWIMTLASISGAITSFIMGLLIDIFIIRKARMVTPVGKQMITMGLVLVISGLLPVIFGVIPIELPRFEYGNYDFSLFGLALTIPKHFVYSIIITVILLGALFIALQTTKWGLGVRATASNEMVASMLGVNTKLITALSWAIAGALGGVAAILLAPLQQNVTVGLMVPVQVNGFMASVLGGFGNFTGPLIGSTIMPLLSSMFTYFNSLWQGVIVYSLVLLIVLVKPQGLLGKKVAKKV